jgi:uncharacterized integral membrane protein
MAADKTMLDIARRRRQRAAIFAGVAGILLVLAIPLHEHAVEVEALPASNFPSYPLGVAALLALVAALLALRSAVDVRAHGVDVAILLLVLAVVLGAIGAFFAFFTPAFYNVVNTCVAEGSKVTFGATAVSGPCGYTVPDSDFSLFYPATAAALLAVISALVSIVLLVRAHVPRGEVG